MLMLTYTSSWKCQTVYFTFTIWSGEPAFMNSSQLLPISDTFLWAITFWIFLIIYLSLLIPSWSSPPGFQVIIITVICVITTLCTEQNSDMHYSINAKLPHKKNLVKFPNSDSFPYSVFVASSLLVSKTSLRFLTVETTLLNWSWWHTLPVPQESLFCF